MDRLRMLEEIWEVMIGVYGVMFVNAHGDQPNPIWAMAVRGVSDFKINAALQKIVSGESKFLDYPPIAPAFAAFARSMPAEVVVVEEPKRISGPVISEETLSENARKAREELKGFLSLMRKSGHFRNS